MPEGIGPFGRALGQLEDGPDDRKPRRLVIPLTVGNLAFKDHFKVACDRLFSDRQQRSQLGLAAVQIENPDHATRAPT